MREFTTASEVMAAVGQSLGYSGWHLIGQDTIDTFAQATGDHQWIHVDQERSRSGPFGSTVAHGYLTLAMVATFSAEIYSISGARMIVNYGADRIRFPSPVPAGAWVCAHAELIKAEPSDGGLRVTVRFTVNMEGAPKPAMIADTLLLAVFDEAKAA